MRYKLAVFDLDGTVLNTLGGLTHALNAALAVYGIAPKSKAQVQNMVGNGTRKLIERSLEGLDPDAALLENVFCAYSKFYLENCSYDTYPYEGITDMLVKLKGHGIKCAVVTNKPDALAKVIVPAHFGEGFFDDVIGIKEGDPVKPDPNQVNKILALNGYKKEEVIYVGDSVTDVNTAENAGIACCLCLWGYGFYKKDLLERANYVIKKPKELANLALWEEK